MKQRIVPLGYVLSNGSITINEAEADTVREIAEQYLSGKSLKDIAEMLTAKHIEYMSGKTDWNRSRIKRIVEDKRYIGDGGYPPILTKQEYAAMQSIKAEKNTQKNVNHTEGIFTLNAPVVCPNCGGRMHRRFDRRRKANTWWQCSECKVSVNISDKDRLTVQLEQYAAMRQKRESAKSRLDEIFTILDGLQNHPMEYNDTLVRQIIECVVVESKEKIKVVFIGGTEIEMTL